MKQLSFFAILMAVPIAFAQQTEDQKRIMARHKKVMIEVDEKAFNQTTLLGSATYLLKRRAGISFVEDQIIAYRKAGKMLIWERTLSYYEETIPIEEMHDKMIGEFVFRLEQRKKYPLTNKVVYRAGEFGLRGLAFLPVLEKIRDEVSSEASIRAVREAIRSIKGQ